MGSSPAVDARYIKTSLKGTFLCICCVTAELESTRSGFDQKEQARRKYRRTCDDAATTERSQSRRRRHLQLKPRYGALVVNAIERQTRTGRLEAKIADRFFSVTPTRIPANSSMRGLKRKKMPDTCVHLNTHRHDINYSKVTPAWFSSFLPCGSNW